MALHITCKYVGYQKIFLHLVTKLIFFSLPMALYITCTYLGDPKSFLFLANNLTVDFVGFLLLPSKIHADAINDLQYCGAKMAMKSEMFVKYWHKVYFCEKYAYQESLSLKIAP